MSFVEPYDQSWEAHHDHPEAIIIGAAMIAVAIFPFSFFGDRYHIVQGPVVSAWKIDKITGAVWLCNAGKCTPFSS